MEGNGGHRTNWVSCCLFLYYLASWILLWKWSKMVTLFHWNSTHAWEIKFPWSKNLQLNKSAPLPLSEFSAACHAYGDVGFKKDILIFKLIISIQSETAGNKPASEITDCFWSLQKNFSINRADNGVMMTGELPPVGDLLHELYLKLCSSHKCVSLAANEVISYECVLLPSRHLLPFYNKFTSIFHLK